jgi:hypothetical protein
MNPAYGTFFANIVVFSRAASPLPGDAARQPASPIIRTGCRGGVAGDFRRGRASPRARQQRSWRRRLDDEPLTFFADDRIIPGQLELARNPQCLIAAASEKPDSPRFHIDLS